MFSINTNTSAMAALQSLTATNVALTQAQSEVSTGKKVNSASDNPALYAISQTMDAQISGLSGVGNSVQLAAQVVSTATLQATSTSTVLQDIQGALSAGGVDMSATINSDLAKINSNANSANFNGTNLLSGTVGSGVTSTTVTASTDLNGDQFVQKGFNISSAGLGLAGLTATGMTGVTVNFGLNPTTMDQVGASGSLGTNVTFSTNVSGSATNPTGTATASNPNMNYTFALNQTGGAGSADYVTSKLASSITTDIQATPNNSGATVMLNSNGSVNSVTGALSTSTDSSGDTIYAFAGGATLTAGMDGNGNAVLTASTRNDTSGNMTTGNTYVAVNTTAATKDSGVTGVNLLTAAIQNQGFGAQLDATTGNVQIAGGNLYTGATGPAVAYNTKGTNGSGIVSTGVTGSLNAVLAVTAAITKVNNVSSALGSATNVLTGIQSSVTNLSTSLTTGVGALTDADLAAESAQLTSLQTKQQLAIQALSIANSGPQSLLSLFK
jgi:flagellin